MGFASRVALVTGSSSGIGAAIALELAAGGAKVAVHYRGNADGANAVMQQITAAGGTCAIYQADVSDTEQAAGLVKQVQTDLGGLDILVNNAGVYPPGTLRDITMEAWDRVFAINCKGVFLASRVFMDPMIEAGYGRMVSIVTVDAYIPKPNMPHYAASKAAVLSLVKTFAQELAPHGILVNGVSPGAIATERAKREGWLGKHIPHIPVGRAGEPEDIAEVVAFLASPSNRFVTGETVVASGGQNMI